MIDTYERIVYRDGGKVKTATLRNVTESSWTLSGTRVDGSGKNIVTNVNPRVLTLHTARDLIGRTPMHFNEGHTHLEE